MLLYQVNRVFFFLFNHKDFPETSLFHLLHLMRGGFWFDLSALLYLNSLYILLMIIPFKFRAQPSYQRILKYIFITTNAVGFILNIGDYFYYPFTLRRTTASIVSEFVNETQIFALFGRFLIDYWYGIPIFALFLVAMIFTFKTVKLTVNYAKMSLWLYFPLHTVSMAVTVGLVVIGMRGGDWHHSTRPISLGDAGVYTSKPKEVFIVLNTPFCIFRTLGTQAYKEVSYYNQEDLNTIYDPIVSYPTDSTRTFVKKNVVIILLESFAREYHGYYNHGHENYEGFTPFLDSLSQHSLRFWYAFANGRKSIDAMPSVYTGIPQIKTHYVLSDYAGNDVKGLPKILDSLGYNTAFYHGAVNGSMGFDSFAKIAGFQHYYGMDEYEGKDKTEGLWGISDGPFLEYMCRNISATKEPFMAGVFTLSSHHPFLVPDNFKEPLREGPLAVHRVIHYTDQSLKKFFALAKKTNWYKNTIFVITADHSSQPYFKEYTTTWGSFAVPIIFFDPSSELIAKESHQVAQQLDITPTILGYLGYSGKLFTFGRNLFAPNPKGVCVNYLDGLFNFFSGDYVIRFNETTPVELYNYRTDSLESHNLLKERPQFVDSMTNIAKAFQQQYYNRMIHNTLRP
jgi:phosphoglycerol transferase MdoB-like AlkP superfamily enzyme